MAVDFAILCPLVRPGRPRYPVLVHRAAALLHASFRPRLATTPLRFANPSPPSGWIEDSHLQAVDHARHTKQCGLAATLSLGHSHWMVPNGAADCRLSVTMPLRSVKYSARRSSRLRAAIMPIKPRRVPSSGSNSADFDVRIRPDISTGPGLICGRSASFASRATSAQGQPRRFCDTRVAVTYPKQQTFV